MTRYLISRGAAALPVLLLASVGIFSLVRLIPGDPAVTLAGPDSTPEMQQAIRGQLGLDQPFLSQYVGWLRDLLTLDLGTSFRLGGDVGALVLDGAGNTVLLTGTALLLAAVGAAVTAVVAVVANRSWLDNVLAAFNTVALAVPSFAVGTLLVIVLAVKVQLLPAGGLPPAGLAAHPDITIQYLALPALSMALPAWAVLTRYLTEGLRTQMSSPYVTTARAAGVPRRQLVLRHALRNALPPAVTVLGIQIGALLGGSLLIENIFAWPGLGRLLGEAINTRDYPVVQVLLLLSVTVFVLAQLVTDMVQASLDPRVRLSGGTR
jgi:peptide/nickel transport system permease protein